MKHTAHRSLRWIFVALLIACHGLLIPSSYAQSPALINYQGRLVDGTNLVNGSVGLTLRMFDAPSGGTLLYADSNTVTVVDGLYATYIGDDTIFGDLDTALTNAQVWLEAVVNGNILTPRERIVSVAYARAVEGLLIRPGYSVVLNPRAGTNSTASTAGFATISGGQLNSVGGNAHYAAIAGGFQNRIESAMYSAIGGGTGNYIATNADNTVIAGGFGNQIHSNAAYGTIGGGQFNLLNSGVWGGSIGGGAFHLIEDNYTFIGGGFLNKIFRNSLGSTIAGGTENTISNQAPYSFIGGGSDNLIENNSIYGVIAGGQENMVSPNSGYSVIGGGLMNLIGSGTYGAAISGGGVLIEDGIWLTIAGNRINASAAFIGGGLGNHIATNAMLGVIAGGRANLLSSNAQAAVVGGGLSNKIGVSAFYAAIPGGRDNEIGAGATNSLAAGRRAKALHRGSFVWADDTAADFATTANNQFLIRSAGGVGINTEAPEAELHIFGGSAGSVTALGTTALALEGSTNTFIQFLTPTNAISGIIMGSPVDTLDASIRYNHFGNREMIFRVGGNNTRVLIDTNGFVGIGTLSPTNRLHVVGTVQATAYITSSDRDLKENLQPVNPSDILEKVAALPISTWTFRDEPNGTHIGPMAQDFHAAFGFGNTDKGIMTVDADGVLFAAVQALAKENEEVKKQNEALRNELEAIKRHLGL